VPRLAILFPLVLLSGCGGQPRWYAPPAQQSSLAPPPSVTFGQFVAMSDPHADACIVDGFREKSEGQWRWTLDHPVLRFWLPPVPEARFVMEFAFPEQTFRQTGPVTLTFAINGKTFDRVRYSRPGAQKYTRTIPAAMLLPGSVNTVAINPDKCASRSESGERLGFVLTSAGFVD